MLAQEGIGSSDTSDVRARELARRALALDSLLPLAHQALGKALANDLRFAESLAEMKRAADLAPDNGLVLAGYGGALAIVGRPEEALELNRRAMALDPLSLGALITAQYNYYMVGKAIETNGACVFTPIGYYMPFTNFTFAFSCPLPFTTFGTGATNVNQCIVLAPAGSFVSPDTHVITACPVGQYQSFGGQDHCFPAPAGSYVPGTGATGFSSCNPGTYSSGGTAACTAAPLGFYVPDSATLRSVRTAGRRRRAWSPSGRRTRVGFRLLPCSAASAHPRRPVTTSRDRSRRLFAVRDRHLPALHGTVGVPFGADRQLRLLPGGHERDPCPAGATTAAVGATSSAQCVTRPLTLGDTKLWIGLKNSDDVGLRLDLRAEVLLNGVVVGSGDLQDVAGGSSGFNNAVLQTIALAMNGAVSVPAGAVLTFRPSVRRTCVGGGHTSGTVRFWYDGPAIDQGTTRNAGSRFAATVATVSSNFFMQDPAALSVTAGTVRQFVDVAVNSNAKCPARPFSSLGEWSMTQP